MSRMFAPNGSEIVAIRQVLMANTAVTNMRRGEEGNLLYDETDEADTLLIDTINPLINNGQRIFVCVNGHLWHESDITFIQRASAGAL